VSPGVLHADFISLSPTAPHDARPRIIREAGGLTAVPGVLDVVLVEGQSSADFELALLFVLEGFAALEPFGTDPAYARFLQGSVAPALGSFAGADVALVEDFALRGGYAACLAVAAPEDAYDWEVRDLLEDWAASALGKDQLSPEDPLRGGVCTGLAAGERQRYRGLVVLSSATEIRAVKPAERRFDFTLIAGPARRLG